MQVEAQEAIIQDISHLCNVAEAVCFKREEQFKQSLFDLPIWASPLELMQVLCDEWIEFLLCIIIILFADECDVERMVFPQFNN